MFRHFVLYIGVHAVVLWVIAGELMPAVIAHDPLAVSLCVLIGLSSLMFLIVQLRNVQCLFYYSPAMLKTIYQQVRYKWFQVPPKKQLHRPPIEDCGIANRNFANPVHHRLNFATVSSVTSFNLSEQSIATIAISASLLSITTVLLWGVALGRRIEHCSFCT